MNPYLVTATDRGGRRDSFVRQAESLEHLRNMLGREGYTDLEFLDNDFSAKLRADRPAGARDDSPMAARREAKMRRSGERDGFWLLAVRNHWFLILIDLGLVAYGLSAGKAWPIAAGAFFLLYWAWTVRRGLGRSDDYNALLRAQARGEFDQCARLIEKMSTDPALSTNALLQFDLAFRRAGLKARRGDLAGALAEAEGLRARPQSANGAFESRVAGLHYQGGDMPGYLASMEASYKASGEAAMQRLDLAFGHARVGDARRARELLAGVDRSLLPPFHVPIANAAEGLLLEREGDAAAAIGKLHDAAGERGGFAANPAFWPFQGIIVALYAASLARAGRRDDARAALQPWREVALNCTDPDTRRFLESEVVN